MNKVNEVIELLSRSHSVFHVVRNMEDALLANGFHALKENEPWDLKPGQKYFVTRDMSSIIAFALPMGCNVPFAIAATHNDSPTFMLKPNPVMIRGDMTQLNVEPYGGTIYYSWLDRPLSFAGRVYSRKDDKTICTLVDIDENLLLIPSLAIHMNRDVNSGHEFNPTTDMIPVWMDHAYVGTFNEYLAKKCGIEGEILSHDLYLYVREEPRCVGEGQSMLLSPRLDDLGSAYASLLAFLEASKEQGSVISVFASFNNEEVGSRTYNGAHSDFLRNTLERIRRATMNNAEEDMACLAASRLLSVDNGHANHPSFPGISDATTKVIINGGIVLKYHANQNYTTNAASAAYVKTLAKSLDLNVQEFTNRSDMRGGSTLGNISNAEISFLTADIGLPQLAMHSSVELCGINDIEDMIRLLALHYRGSVR